MKKFEIEIKETLSRTVIVTAESEEDALKLVDNQYRNAQIVLDSDDFVDYEISSKD